MAYHRKQSGITEKDKAVLRAFLDCSVPRQYYSLSERGNLKIDFDYYYEEIYDFADALARGEEIDLNCNFVGVPASAVTEEFRKILDVIARRDPVLEVFCDRFSQAITVIARAAK